MHNVVISTTILSLFAAGNAAAQQPASPPPTGPAAVATSVTEAPAIDGRLDDAAWARGQALSEFAQREPTEGQPVSERTEVRILYDEQALYIGAWLHDRDPGGIVVGRTLRDASLGDSDAFLVIFDTYLDRQNGFVFGTTPSGIEYDGQVTDEGGGAVPGGGGGGGGGGAACGDGLSHAPRSNAAIPATSSFLSMSGSPQSFGPASKETRSLGD